MAIGELSVDRNKRINSQISAAHTTIIRAIKIATSYIEKNPLENTPHLKSVMDVIASMEQWLQRFYASMMMTPRDFIGPFNKMTEEEMTEGDKAKNKQVLINEANELIRKGLSAFSALKALSITADPNFMNAPLRF